MKEAATVEIDECFEVRELMMMVSAFLSTADELMAASDDSRRLPSVECVRPSCCPRCGALAYRPDGSLGIVGHGSYVRRVAGVGEPTRTVAIRVQRYRCKECSATISVLPDSLYPRRRYAASAIMDALRSRLFDHELVRDIRRRVAQTRTDSGSWRTLQRWRSQLLFRLWGWLGRRLGVAGLAETLHEGRRRLLRLMAEIHPVGPGGDYALAGTIHAIGECWRIGHKPPGCIEGCPSTRTRSRPSTIDVRSSCKSSSNEELSMPSPRCERGAHRRNHSRAGSNRNVFRPLRAAAP